MVNEKTAEYLEIALITFLISLAFSLLTIGTVILISVLIKKHKQNISEMNMDFKLKKKSAKKFRGLFAKTRSSYDTFVFYDDKDCVIKYKIVHFPNVTNEKLSMKLQWIKIGGSNELIETQLYYFHQIYFRILLNNRSTNSIIVSDKYPFKNHIDINETFIFQLQKQQLENTSFVIEAFANFKNRNDEFFIGWIEVEFLDSPPFLFIDKEEILNIPDRIRDLYFKSVGYLCISLSYFNDEIKVGILATTYLEPGINVLNLENFKLYFIIKSRNKNQNDQKERQCSIYKWFKPTIIWNEIFTFNFTHDLKSDHTITINLWKVNSVISIVPNSPKKIGSVKLGSGLSFNKKAEDHWESIFLNENEDIVKWHSINIDNK